MTLLPQVRQAGGAACLRRGLYALGAVLFVATSLYGFGGPFVYGHYGYHAGEYSTRARHTLRQGSLLPGNVPGSAAPTPGTYYLHHPIFTPQIATLTFAVAGDSESSVRLAALLSSAATLIVLVVFVCRHYGPWYGAWSAVLASVVPFNIWYATHIDHGYPGLVFVLLCLLSYGQWLRQLVWKDGLWTLLFIAAAGCFDWTPFLFAVPFGVHVLVTGIRRRGRCLAFVPCFVGAVLVPIAIHALALTAAHQWSDFEAAYRTRSASMPLAAFANVMAAYGKDLFGVPLLAVAGSGFIIASWRLARGQGGIRALALVSLATAMLLHLLVFRVEVVTHAYRLIYVSPVVVLGAAETVAALIAIGGRWAAAPVRSAAVIVATALVVLTLPQSWRGLLESRAHGGIPNWKTMDPNLPRSLLARVLRDRSRLGDRVYLHSSFPFRMEIGFYLDRDLVPSTVSMVASLSRSEQTRSVFAFDVSALSPSDEVTVARLAAEHPLTCIGHYGFIDLRGAAASPAAYVLNVHPRTWWRRYWEGPYPWPSLERVRPAAMTHRLCAGRTNPSRDLEQTRPAAVMKPR